MSKSVSTLIPGEQLHPLSSVLGLPGEAKSLKYVVVLGSLFGKSSLKSRLALRSGVILLDLELPGLVEGGVVGHSGEGFLGFVVVLPKRIFGILDDTKSGALANRISTIFNAHT